MSNVRIDEMRREIESIKETVKRLSETIEKYQGNSNMYERRIETLSKEIARETLRKFETSILA